MFELLLEIGHAEIGQDEVAELTSTQISIPTPSTQPKQPLTETQKEELDAELDELTEELD